MDDTFTIRVEFGERRRQRSALAFASDLAVSLGALPLHVYLPSSPRWPLEDSARLTQKMRVAALLTAWKVCQVELHDEVDLAAAATRGLPARSIVIAGPSGPGPISVPVLYPFEERALTPGGFILAPFGDGQDGLTGAALAVPLARKLDRQIVFYHTTWRVPGEDSPDPVKHMCPAALAHKANLSAHATAAGVPHTFVVEMADDVAFGMLACALRPVSAESEVAALIVLAYGMKTYVGSYVEKCLSRSATPIVVAPAPPAEGGSR